MLKKLNNIYPLYAVLPIIILFLVNTLAYYGGRLIAGGWHHYDLSLPLDHMIPFMPWAISIYILSYVFWVGGYAAIGRESRDVCYEIFLGDIFAKLLCMACFLIIPTTLVRPEVTGGGIWNDLTRLIYMTDVPDNLFPSVHCLESWMIFRGALRCKKMPRWWTWFSLVFTFMVFASTVLVKQHVFIDIPAGVLMGEIGIFIAKKTNAKRLFYHIEPKWVTLYE